METSAVKDAEWVRRAFLSPADVMTEDSRREAMFSTASMSFTDSSIGGGFAVNPPPQFTRTADIRMGSKSARYRGTGASGGQGRAYHEDIERHLQRIHFQFGVTQFNGMFTFFTGFYNGAAGIMARTGRAPGFFYRLGQIGGFIVGFRAWAILAIGNVWRFLTDQPSSKYCYLKPTMHSYWNRVNYILNAIAVEMKIVKPVIPLPQYGVAYDDEGNIPQYNDEDRKALRKFWPDIFREDGTIDVYSVAGRAQRMADNEHYFLKGIYEETRDMDELVERLNRYRTDPDITIEDTEGTRDFSQYIEDWINSPQGRYPEDEEGQAAIYEGTGRAEIDRDKVNPNVEVRSTWQKVLNWAAGEQAMEQFMAEMLDGSQFVSFNVNHLGTTTDTFSNSVGESAIASKLNGISSSARSARFSFSDGNTGFDLVDSAFGAVRDLAAGVLDGVGMSGLVSLFGASFTEIPQEWKDSNASVETTTYTMQLRSPYGSPMARLLCLYYPLACILAASLPISTGKASYSSPFHCYWYHRGFSHCRYGMITNLAITSGVGSAGWTDNNEPLGFDVTFTVSSLSNIMHAPIQAGFDQFNPFADLAGGEDAFMDYVARISGRSFSDMYYSSRRLVTNLTKKWTNVQSFFTVSRSIQWANSLAPSRAISGIFFPPGSRGG